MPSDKPSVLDECPSPDKLRHAANHLKQLSLTEQGSMLWLADALDELREAKTRIEELERRLEIALDVAEEWVKSTSVLVSARREEG